jgi:hypothetical protein
MKIFIEALFIIATPTHKNNWKQYIWASIAEWINKF